MQWQTLESGEATGQSLGLASIILNEESEWHVDVDMANNIEHVDLFKNREKLKWMEEVEFS